RIPRRRHREVAAADQCQHTDIETRLVTDEDVAVDGEAHSNVPSAQLDGLHRTNRHTRDSDVIANLDRAHFRHFRPVCGLVERYYVDYYARRQDRSHHCGPDGSPAQFSVHASKGSTHRLQRGTPANTE